MGKYANAKLSCTMKAPAHDGEVDDLDLLLGQLEDYAFLNTDDTTSSIDKHSRQTPAYRDRSPNRDYSDLAKSPDRDLAINHHIRGSREELNAFNTYNSLDYTKPAALPDENVKYSCDGIDNQDIKFNDILAWVWSTQQQLQTVHLSDVPLTAAATATTAWSLDQSQATAAVSTLMLPPPDPPLSSARSDKSYTSIATIPSQTTSDQSFAWLSSRPPSVSSFTLSDRPSRPPSEKTSRPSSRRASPVRSRAASRASSPKFGRASSPLRRNSTCMKCPREIESRSSSPTKGVKSRGSSPKRSRPSSPKTPGSEVKPSSSTEVTPAKLPRYKRPSHISAEYKRRGKIKKGFEDLITLVPTVNASGKDTKVQILNKCVEFLRNLRTECKQVNREVESLRSEVEELNLQVGKYQEELPDSGAEVLAKQTDMMQSSLDQRFNEYVQRETKKNWKFWIFSQLIYPLFESYKVLVCGETSETFSEAVCEWVKKHCSLTSLRPAALKSLRRLSKVSSIMTEPEKLPHEAMEAVSTDISSKPL